MVAQALSQDQDQDQSHFISQLARLADERARRKIFRHHPQLHHPAMVERLYEETVKLARVDLQQADRLAQAASWLAEKLDDDYCRAQSLRATGHVLYLRRKYQPALRRYQAALALFKRLRRTIDVGRTLSGSVQPLIYLGRYEQAFAYAQKAREIFEKHGDRVRLARLELHIGNILYRQDRFAEALESYKAAYSEFRKRGEAEDVAIALRNLAVCYISLDEFAQALQTYQEARSYCEQHGMPLLVAEADYNIAYLYYLRGEYTRAIELYQATRQFCATAGDAYHKALCDLDQSEMYLELNLIEEGAELAQQAFVGFKELEMQYEAAKALAFLAIATAHQGKITSALQLFDRARELFTREKNRLWPALIDLYEALVLYQNGGYAQARVRCRAALRFFATSSLSSKAALCELLLTRLHLQAGQLTAARRTCAAALARFDHAHSPALGHQAYFVLGQVEEALGNPAAAFEAYRNAHARLENLRSHLRAEELKIAFLKDKLAVYESLVWMSLEDKRSPKSEESAFAYIEQAKSRSLADLIAFRAHALPAATGTRSVMVEKVRHLREELNWYYRQIALEEMQTKRRSSHHQEGLRQRARECESQLTQALSELPPEEEEFTALQNAGTIELEAIRSMIPANTMLLEYYQARGRFYVCLLNRDRLEIVPLTQASRVQNLFRLLQFQLTKFRFGPDYARDFSASLHEATLTHLSELEQELVAPIRERLKAEHLIIVPHDFLHYLPFHALFDGRNFLSERFTVSYAPSASVCYLCCGKESVAQDQSLILGIPDPLTPFIEEEVRSVASALPNPKLFLGGDATAECLREHGPHSRFVHVATHGLFRQDNPMFSSIRLSDSLLSLFDLYQLRLPAELVTLSGCGTGLNVVVGGDELLGLVRGLLYAGALSVLVTLWDVNDQSTAQFMKWFYQHLRATPNKALALQRAMRDLRQAYPHPYYWAPFVLVGKPFPI